MKVHGRNSVIQYSMLVCLKCLKNKVTEEFLYFLIGWWFYLLLIHVLIYLLTHQFLRALPIKGISIVLPVHLFKSTQGYYIMYYKYKLLYSIFTKMHTWCLTHLDGSISFFNVVHSYVLKSHKIFNMVTKTTQ